eukprot:1608533-Rhodomonas_salina.2
METVAASLRCGNSWYKPLSRQPPLLPQPLTSAPTVRAPGVNCRQYFQRVQQVKLEAVEVGVTSRKKCLGGGSLDTPGHPCSFDDTLCVKPQYRATLSN